MMRFITIFKKTPPRIFAYSGKNNGDVYYDNQLLINRDKKDNANLFSYKYKLHINLEEKSFQENKDNIIAIIEKSAAEADIGTLINSYKHRDIIESELKQTDDESKEVKFWQRLANVTTFSGELPEIKREYPDLYQANKKLIETASTDELNKNAEYNLHHIQFKLLHKKRLIDKSQLTLYLSDAKHSEEVAVKLAKFIAILEREFNQAKLKSSQNINMTDAPLTEFVSFRQEKLDDNTIVPRFEKDDELNLIFISKILPQLKMQQQNSALYKDLKSACLKSKIYVEKPEIKLAGNKAEEFLKKEQDEERRFLQKKHF